MTRREALKIKTKCDESVKRKKRKVYSAKGFILLLPQVQKKKKKIVKKYKTFRCKLVCALVFKFVTKWTFGGSIQATCSHKCFHFQIERETQKLLLCSCIYNIWCRHMTSKYLNNRVLQNHSRHFIHHLTTNQSDEEYYAKLSPHSRAIK